MKAKRILGNNPFDFLVKNIIPNNLFVSIGYFCDSALSYGPRTRKSINQENNKKLEGFINGTELTSSPKFKEYLRLFHDSEKYQQVLSGEKNTAPFDLSNDVHIIKISRTVVRWLQNSKFLSKYGKWGEEESYIRMKHGFGGSDIEYDETDWRRKPEYKGTSKYPKSERNENPERKYNIPVGQSGIFSNAEDPSKMAIRQFANLGLTEKPEWYLVDENGYAEQLNNNVLHFLRTEYTNHRVKEAIGEISEEEKAFLDEFNKFAESYRPENMYFLENILYITGTSVDMRGNKQPFTWVNTNLIYKKYPYLKRNFINSVIAKYIDFSKEDIERLTESLVRKNTRNKKLV